MSVVKGAKIYLICHTCSQLPSLSKWQALTKSIKALLVSHKSQEHACLHLYLEGQKSFIMCQKNMWHPLITAGQIFQVRHTQLSKPYLCKQIADVHVQILTCSRMQDVHIVQLCWSCGTALFPKAYSHLWNFKCWLQAKYVHLCYSSTYWWYSGGAQCSLPKKKWQSLSKEVGEMYGNQKIYISLYPSTVLTALPLM